jgi:pimeloyl-ACP methyl ester carboxylesterase
MGSAFSIAKLVPRTRRPSCCCTAIRHLRACSKIQADLFWSYQTNVASYPIWQAWMRQHEPPVLVVWGRYDPSFTVDGAAAYKQAVSDAEVHILDAGHFALDEKLDDIAALIRGFLSRQPPPFGTSN